MHLGHGAVVSRRLRGGSAVTTGYGRVVAADAPEALTLLSRKNARFDMQAHAHLKSVYPNRMCKLTYGSVCRTGARAPVGICDGRSPGHETLHVVLSTRRTGPSLVGSRAGTDASVCIADGSGHDSRRPSHVREGIGRPVGMLSMVIVQRPPLRMTSIVHAWHSVRRAAQRCTKPLERHGA